MGCGCDNVPKKRSWFYYFCCGKPEDDSYKQQRCNGPYQGKSKAYVQNNTMPEDFHKCGCEQPYEPTIGNVTRLEYVTDDYPVEPLPQEECQRPTYQPQQTSSAYPSSKVYVNSATNYCGNSTSTASSKGVVFHPQHQNEYSGENRIRLNAPQPGFNRGYNGGFSGGYMDASGGQSTSVIRFG